MGKDIVLLLDSQCVESAEGVEFHLNQAAKHPENPVLVPGFPHEWDSLQVNWPSCVLYDPEDRLFRCWYHGLDVVQYDVNQYPERRPFAKWLGRIWRCGYAESPDGVHWTKPPLGQYLHRGADTNAIITDYEKSGTGMGFDHFAALSAVWLNPQAQSAEEKFLGLFTEIGADSSGNRSFRTFRKTVYCSPDGKRWMRRAVAYDGGSDQDNLPAENVLDIFSVIQEPGARAPEFRAKAYGQTDRGGNSRGVGMVCGPDLCSLRYEGLRILLEADKRYEDEIHYAAVRKLENGHYLMIHDSDRFSYDGTDIPRADIRLAISGDGVDFRRVHPDTPIVPRGAKAMFDANQLVCSSIVEHGDEILFYYHGTPCQYRPWPYTRAGVPIELRASTVHPSFLGLATLPRDRLGYATGNGAVVTLPLAIGDGGLWVNAEERGGELAIDLLTPGGAVATSGRLGTETSRSVYRRAVWDSPVRPGTYRVRLALRGSARIFSVAAM